MLSPNPSLKFAFFGTDQFAVMILEHLSEAGLFPDILVTAPDRPQGRKLLISPPPVKVWGEKLNIKTIQPETLADAPIELTADPYDFFLVASYGQIIPLSIINLPKMGTLNIHPSLLPKYRGATPLETAILNGDETSGVTIMKMDEKLDHGPIIISQELNIAGKDYPAVEKETAELGAELLINILPAYLSGQLIPKDQDHTEATFTKKITKADGLIDLEADSKLNYQKFLAYKSWPGIYFFTTKNGQKTRVKVTGAHLDNNQFIIDTVIPENKKEMSWQAFNQS